MFTITFDVDDTLVSIDPALHLEAHRRALRAVGATTPLHLSGRGVIEWDVGAKRRLPETVWGIAHYLTGSKAPVGFAQQYGAALDAAWAELLADGAEVVAVPGAVEVLDAAETERFALGMVSGATRAVASRWLAAAGLAPERFSVGGFGDGVERPMIVAAAVGDANPRQPVLAHVSSNVLDVRAARNAAVLSIGVANEQVEIAQFARLDRLPDATLGGLGQRVVELATAMRAERERSSLAPGRYH
ncbi:MAG: HAD family hydrolase [Acidimicrobiia bacterium]